MNTRSSILLVCAVVALLTAANVQNHELRNRRGVQSDDLENTPPLLAITTVILGGFRGLVADILWLRASSLQDEGRHFELVQLADWITKLEPGIPEIWSFHAWNMAFNVSVMMRDPSERWRWIQNGIALLRDQALRYNPHAPSLYSELAWIYSFKIGGQTDFAHAHYKRRLAQAMHAILSGGSLNGVNVSDEIATELKNVQGLDSELMAKLDVRFGPLDWRLPESFAIYWAVQGLEHTTEEPDMLCERMLRKGLESSFVKGTLDFDPASGRYERTNNFEVLPKLMVVYDTALEQRPTGLIRSSYAGFLGRAIEILRQEGKKDESRRLANRLEEISGSE